MFFVAGCLLQVSAQDTFEEVLGWYGLRPYTQFTDRCAEVSPMDTASTGSVMTRDTASVTRDTASIVSRDSSAEDADIEVDGDHPVDLTSMAPTSSSSAADQGTMCEHPKFCFFLIYHSSLQNCGV